MEPELVISGPAFFEPRPDLANASGTVTHGRVTSPPAGHQMYLSTALPVDWLAAPVATTAVWLAEAVTVEGEAASTGADTELDFDADEPSFIAPGAGSTLEGIGPGKRIL